MQEKLWELVTTTLQISFTATESSICLWAPAHRTEIILHCRRQDSLLRKLRCSSAKPKRLTILNEQYGLVQEMDIRRIDLNHLTMSGSRMSVCFVSIIA